MHIKSYPSKFFPIFISIIIVSSLLLVQVTNFVNSYGQVSNKFYSFSGTNYKDIKNSESIHLKTFSISLLVKTSNDFTGTAFLINKGGFGSETAGQNLNYGVWFTSNERIQAGFETKSGSSKYVTSPKSYNDGKWHYITVTNDGSKLKLFIDGQEVSSLTTSSSPDNTGNQPLRLGANSLHFDRFFTGSLDEIRIWDRGLSNEEISNMYSNDEYNTDGQVLLLTGSDTDIPSPPSPPNDPSCTPLSLSAVTASGSQSTLPPKNVNDGDLNTRWSNLGLGSWIQLDLGSKKEICSIDISWYRGHERQMNFIVSTSNDGTQFTNIYTGKSNGNTSSFENYNFENIQAKYVKVTVTGNTMNSWVSISEIKINGKNLTPSPPDSTAKLNVIKQLINDDGGTKKHSDFVITVNGINANPNSFPGSSLPSGTLVNLNPGSYSVSEQNTNGYTSSFSSGCSGIINSGETKTCIITNNDNKPDSPPNQNNSGTDVFGIKKIYQTKQNGEEWFMNMNNPNSDIRSDPKMTLTKNSDGSWKSTNSKVRYNVFTSTGYHPDDVVKNHNIVSQRGYMQSSNDWKNVEITGYIKVNDGLGDENFAWYARGGKHTSSGSPDGCEGSSYKVDLFYNGQIRFAKEQWHVSYVFSPTKSGIGSIFDKWVGFKGIMYNLEQNGKTVVKLETWIDKNANGNWVKVDERIDSGGWGTEGEECNGKPDQIITWGGPITTFRWDGADDVDIKYFSVREIQP